jgi:hypothetical protein
MPFTLPIQMGPVVMDLRPEFVQKKGELFFCPDKT